MKLYRLFIYGLILSTVSISCGDDYESNAADKAIALTVPDKDIKMPGYGQYRMQVESNHEASVTANVASSELRSLTITKTVNVVKDASFGSSGTMTVDLSTFGSAYVFTYTPPTTEVDKLVGFTFQGQYADGSVRTSDLALAVTLSPKDNISKRKWLFTSKLWVDKDNLQDIKPCEMDNYFLFNADGTMSADYGQLTNVDDCGFDWASAYDGWELSEDEKSFTIKKHAWNTPDIITSETFEVKTFTTEKIELQIAYDLSWIDPKLTTPQTFIYQYTARPR